jgi:hypothetical protein
MAETKKIEKIQKSIGTLCKKIFASSAQLGKVYPEQGYAPFLF